MIPKIIHYCWFGGKPLTPLAKRCIESWKKFCPDYEIIRWDESNYDVTKNIYMKEAYDAQKWGFVPDYARLDIVYHYGGIYMDTDVELVKPLDDLLNHRAFMGVEKPGIVALGLGFGADKGNSVIFDLLNGYENRRFIVDGKLDLTAAPKYQKPFFEKYGIVENKLYEIKEGCFVYPVEYFCPIDMETGRLHITENTYSIHRYAASWESKGSIIRGKIYRFINRHFGKKAAERAKKIKKKVCSLFK